MSAFQSWRQPTPALREKSIHKSAACSHTIWCLAHMTQLFSAVVRQDKWKGDKPNSPSSVSGNLSDTAC